jgi:hypothetical protein
VDTALKRCVPSYTSVPFLQGGFANGGFGDIDSSAYEDEGERAWWALSQL